MAEYVAGVYRPVHSKSSQDEQNGGRQGRERDYEVTKVA
jgi:hypothetical protein